jgi:hypothetical protein
MRRDRDWERRKESMPVINDIENLSFLSNNQLKCLGRSGATGVARPADQSTMPKQSNSMDEPIANLKVVSYYATSGMPIDPYSAERLAGAPFVFPHVWHAASVFARKGPASNESLVSLTPARSFLFSVNSCC